MPRPGTSTTRGYGRPHRRLRAALLPTAYGRACPRCGAPMTVGQALDLDHTDDRTGYLGFSHRACNRAAGAALGNRARAPFIRAVR